MVNETINGYLMISKIVEDDATAGNIAIVIAILSFIATIFGPIVRDVIGRHQERESKKKEESKKIAETNNLDADTKLASAEVITEKNKSDEIYVDTSRKMIDNIEKSFDIRIKAMEERQKLDMEVLLKKQFETDSQLSEIRKENENIRLENDRIKRESLDLHQENKKLNEVINRLQSAIKGLKKLIERLLGGINKLISKYEEDHKSDVIPWKPVLTEEEQALLQNDFDFKDFNLYR